ncbi:hypothetical protein EVA_06731 [gut metagenome]|uniref:Uncharacterized protein n=1 Tax=gut metagenome TaxID=749906 RepID=J9CY35_9ZZZZ
MIKVYGIRSNASSCVQTFEYMIQIFYRSDCHFQGSRQIVVRQSGVIASTLHRSKVLIHQSLGRSFSITIRSVFCCNFIFTKLSICSFALHPRSFNFIQVIAIAVSVLLQILKITYPARFVVIRHHTLVFAVSIVQDFTILTPG